MKGGNIGYSFNYKDIIGGLPARTRYNKCGSGKKSNFLLRGF